MAGKGFGLVAAWLLCGVALAQAPAGPDYGPPSCPGSKWENYQQMLKDAHSEQQEGLHDAHALLSDEPLENFDLQRWRVAGYASCKGSDGCYWADIDAQYKRAEQALDAELKVNKPGEKLAMVFDIDETVLSKYCQLPVEGFGYIEDVDDAWQMTSSGVLIPGSLRLFNQAKAAGVAVFFITGRPGEGAAHSRHNETEATRRNLEAAGFHGWAGLALRNGAENAMPTIAYKSAERKKIVDKGYRIVMSVGDQWTDLQGEFKADVSVKLPNPFYDLP